MSRQLETLNKKKEKHQLAVVDAWVKNEYIGTAEMATGVGKNFAAFQCILRFVSDMAHHNIINVLVLAEVTDREKDFFNDLDKFDRIYGTNLRYGGKIAWQFACYQSAYKWENQYFDLVVADEIHDSLTFEYSKFYENNNYAALIGLSATVDRNRVINETAVEEENVEPIKKGFLLDQYAPSIYQLNQSQAIEEGLIAGYEICVLYHKLDESKKTMTGGTKAKPFKTTEKSAYDFVDNRFKKARFIENARTKKFQLSTWSRKRAAILYDLPSKIAVLKQLEQLNERKIIFGNSLDALLEVTPNVVSSRNSEEKNKLIRDDFEKGKTNTIASFKKLKQGANIPDVKLGILHSYYSTVKDYIQRLGRVLRLDGDKQAKVVVFVTIGTKEQDWFDKMTAEIDVPVRGFTKIDDLIKYLQE